MTLQAPLTQEVKSTSQSVQLFRPKAVKTLIGAVVAAALTSACAHKQSDSGMATSRLWQDNSAAAVEVAATGAIGSPTIEAASFGTGAPALARGMNPSRKMALRALAENSVRTDNPGHYTVVSGDTLWDISERFLSRPWLWPEIWHINPQIDNPHLIFPGDEISLTYVDGRPRLQLVRASSKGNAGNAEMATTDLIRTAASTQSNGATSATRTATNVPISNFPIDSIRQFLVEPQVVSKSELKSAPYVVGTEDDRLIASAGNHVYVRGQTDNSRYSVYRAGEPLVDPDTREVLGHEAIHVSKVSLIKSGDPSKMVITSNNRETLVGDRLMSISQSLPLSFQPRMANPGVKGKIINLVNAVSRSGQNQVVVLNLGSSDGVQAGDVMSIISDDRRIKDTVSGKKNDYVTVKGDESGAVMVFRTFDRVSYALIMKSNRAIRLYDRVAVTDL